MRLFFVFAACLAHLWFGAAQAQGPILPGPGLTTAVAASYAGPGDVFSTTPYAWFSCARSYNAAYAAATGNLCDIVDTATGTASCTIKAKTNGFADLTSLLCAGGTVSVTTFCTVTHAAGCSVTKAYNQTNPGTCDVVQATLASMPLLLLNSTPSGALPAMQASGTVGTLQVSSCVSKNQPLTFSGVIIRTSGSSIAQLMGASGAAVIGFDSTANAYVGDGTTNIDVSATNNVWHAVNALNNVASTSINVDGTTNSGTLSTTSIPSNLLRAVRVASLTGTVAFAEGGVWAATSTTTDLSNLCKNQASVSNGYNFAFGC